MKIRNKMKAAMLYAPRDLRIEEVETPDIKNPDEVLIKLKASGVCPTDVRKYTGASKPSGFPAILGHEGAGIVVDAGKIAEKHFKEGQAVTILPVWPCRTCLSCHSGKVANISIAMCDHPKGALGNSAADAISDLPPTVGTFAEYVKVPYDVVYPVPSRVPFEEAALTEPMGSCLNATEWGGKVNAGDNILIIGAGFMGIATAQFAKIKGANVIISDLIEDKLKIAKEEIGVDRTVNIKKEDLVNAVNEFTEGQGVDSVITAVGGRRPLEDAMKVVGKAGRIVLLGSYHPPIKVEIDPNLFHYKMVTITGIEGFTEAQFQKILLLRAHKTIKVKPLITHTFKLDELEKAFEMVEQSKGLRKVILF